MSKLVKTQEALQELDKWCYSYEGFEGLYMKVKEDISLSLLRVDTLLDNLEVLKEISPEPELLLSILKDLRTNLLTFSAASYEKPAMADADLVLRTEMLLNDCRTFITRPIVLGLGTLDYRPYPIVLVEGED